MLHHIFRSTKRGNAADEYEDAAAADAGRFAVADGATESSFVRAWADLLVEGYVSRPPEDAAAWAGWLAPLRGRWADGLAGRRLPWFAQTKLEQGAFAAFVGLSLSDDRRWLAAAVGDSCLFRVREGSLDTAFPLSRSEEFAADPWLVGSRGRPGEAGPAWASGDWRPGDRFWLMTDALAKWFLETHEAGGRPWDDLGRVADGPADAFAAWVDALRDARELRNDDVTLVAVRV